MLLGDEQRRHRDSPFIRPLVDVPWGQSPQPVWVFPFEVFSDFLVVVWTSIRCGSVCPERLAKTVSRDLVPPAVMNLLERVRLGILLTRATRYVSADTDAR